MRDGVDIIYQAVLADDTWSGRADFLRKVDLPGDLGKWSSIHQKKHKWVRVLNHEFHGGTLARWQDPFALRIPVRSIMSPTAAMRARPFMHWLALPCLLPDR